MLASSPVLPLVMTAVPRARWGGGRARLRLFLSAPVDDVDGKEAVTAVDVEAAVEAEL